jgi:hypothetical protein
LAVGDRIWLTPEKYLGRIPGQTWRVAAVDEGRALVLQQRPPDNPSRRHGRSSSMPSTAGERGC